MLRRSILTLSFVALGTLAARADLVNLIPGSTVKATSGVVRGTVTAESATEVTVRVGAANQVVPVSQIASIRYDGRTGTFDQAVSREAAGQFTEAADLYKKAATESASKPFIAADAQASYARVLGDQGMTDPSKLDAGIAALSTFIKSNAESRHLLPSLETLAKLQLQKGSYDDATATIDRLSKIPQSSDRAAVLRARVASRKGQHADAIREFDKLIAESADGSVKRRDAQLAKAESLVALKKYQDAETLVKGVIAAAPAEDIATQASAHNTLGDCLRAAGRPKDALFAYLHTDLLFFKDKEQHPKALSKIAQTYQELKRPDRAEEAIERLRQEYPKSPYTAALPPKAGS